MDSTTVAEDTPSHHPNTFEPPKSMVLSDHPLMQGNTPILPEDETKRFMRRQKQNQRNTGEIRTPAKNADKIADGRKMKASLL